MKSKQKKQIIIIVLLLLLVASVGGIILFQKAQQKPASIVEKYNKTPMKVVGYIDQVKKNKLKIHKEDNTTLVFLLDATNIHNNHNLKKGDHVKIQYVENRNKKKVSKATDV